MVKRNDATNDVADGSVFVLRGMWKGACSRHYRLVLSGMDCMCNDRCGAGLCPASSPAAVAVRTGGWAGSTVLSKRGGAAELYVMAYLLPVRSW